MSTYSSSDVFGAYLWFINHLSQHFTQYNIRGLLLNRRTKKPIHLQGRSHSCAQHWEKHYSEHPPVISRRLTSRRPANGAAVTRSLNPESFIVGKNE